MRWRRIDRAPVERAGGSGASAGRSSGGSGGVTTGGSNSGGAYNGGGTNAGGINNGGTDAGGINNGGTDAGGINNGGANTGGSATWTSSNEGFSYEGMQYIAAYSVNGCDPCAFAIFFSTGDPANSIPGPFTATGNLWQRVAAPSGSTWANQLDFEFYGQPPTTLPATYSISSSGPGQVHISLSGVSNGCEGESGSITITKFGAVGDMIEGSYMISSFVPPVASGCPSTPLEGAFCDRRDPDY